MIPIKLIALFIVAFALAGLMVPAGVSNTAVFAQGADQIIDNVESLVSDEITAFLDEDDEDGNDEEEEVETEEGDGNGGDEQGDDNQNIDQTNEQEQEAEQEVEQNNDQSETNAQSNELNTGDNTATVTQANAADQAVEAAAAAESGDAEAEAEDEDHNKGKKHHYYGDSDSTSADADSIATATAEATGIIEQDNEANIEQDSSANDNILVNENEFGDDENTQVAVPIIDQDQTAANLAAQLDVTVEPTPTPPTTPTPPDDGVLPPEEEDAVFCVVEEGTCFESLAECQAVVDLSGAELRCQGFETLPEGFRLCTFEEPNTITCQV